MLSYGCTRLEIGVQSTYEDVARDTNRGHTVAAVEDCFSLAKDAGFKDILVGLLRLRKCGKNATCPELMGKCSIVRELHVYGTAVPVHGRDADKLQHQGYGTLLMEEAEGIATREHRSTKIAVISVEYLNIEFEREVYSLNCVLRIQCIMVFIGQKISMHLGTRLFGILHYKCYLLFPTD
ncbi:elongator complex protein 3-like [Salvia splendens]|uniref:elongator complex protein 3-like n=1 Tax=Salvia splendens TaxID=180675 RepID=UPI001C280DD7|nr:elongator complex protein 3-like [Salvia splendens]